MVCTTTAINDDSSNGFGQVHVIVKYIPDK